MASPVQGAHFVLNTEDQGIIIATFILYLDDHIINANEGLIGKIKDQMNKMFRMNDLGIVFSFLAMNIELN